MLGRAGRTLSTLWRGPGPSFEARVMEPAAQPADPAFALLARQLASGLWDDGADAQEPELRQLQATARALIALLRLGVDASHAQHGELIRKAIAALLPLAAALAAHASAAVEEALAAAWLASSGKRTRRALRQVIADAGLSALDARLDDEAALRLRLIAR